MGAFDHIHTLTRLDGLRRFSNGDLVRTNRQTRCPGDDHRCALPWAIELEEGHFLGNEPRCDVHARQPAPPALGLVRVDW